MSYQIVKFTAVGIKKGDNRKRVAVRLVVSGFFEKGDIVDIIDLTTLVKYEGIKVVQYGKETGAPTMIIHSMFTKHKDNHAMLRKLTETKGKELVKRAKNDPFIHPHYLIMNSYKQVLLTVLDEFALRKIGEEIGD